MNEFQKYAFICLIINPFHILTKNCILWKVIIFSKKLRITLFYTFANLFKLIWLNKRWLNLHICFYIQPADISNIIYLWKTSLYTPERTRMKRRIMSPIMKIVFTQQTPWKSLGDPQGSPDHTSRTTNAVEYLIRKFYHLLLAGGKKVKSN